ncbi:MAG TPA: hypothetical protein VMX35_11185, partial [Acidobacteriota bacterium]|nr:hypothetical protein [Acidobacteriota bacterium]
LSASLMLFQMESWPSFFSYFSCTSDIQKSPEANICSWKKRQALGELVDQILPEAGFYTD